MRRPLSSNRLSTEDQAKDVVDWLKAELPDVHAELLDEMPEVANIQMSGSSVDTEAMGVDVEWCSWLVDWLEYNAPVEWDDGEPFTFECYLHGGYSYSAPHSPEFFRNVEAAMDEWWDRMQSNGLRKVNGTYFPAWGEMESGDTAITVPGGDVRIQAAEIAWYAETQGLPASLGVYGR